MKANSALVALAAVAVIAMQPVQASTINGGATDVGGIDVVVSSTTLSRSGIATEEAWVRDFLGTSYIISSKIEDISMNSWTATDTDPLVFATNLGLNSGDYFIIKTGNNPTTGDNSTNDRHYLFKNEDSLSWAVISLKDSFGVDVELTGISKVSHISNVSSVPLPAAAWLFGSALLGFVTLSNRKKL
jgi:hypothetical protein